MSLLVRRRVESGKKRNQQVTYLGDTPNMHDNNRTTGNLVTLIQPAGIVFNYILVISKDRKAYKELSYHQDTLTFVGNGKISYDTTPYSGSYYADNGTNSFTLGSRNSTENIIVGHYRMTSTAGTFYTRFPQAFEVYALTLPYENGDIR